MMTVEPASPEQIALFYGRVPVTMTAFCLARDGRPVGLFGLEWHKGYRIAFSSLLPEGRLYKKHILKCGKLLVELIKESRFPVFAVRDKNEPTSDALLRHLGFEPHDNEVYLWQWQQQ